jgi:hypothetical protein
MTIGQTYNGDGKERQKKIQKEMKCQMDKSTEEWR